MFRTTSLSFNPRSINFKFKQSTMVKIGRNLKGCAVLSFFSFFFSFSLFSLLTTTPTTSSKLYDAGDLSLKFYFHICYTHSSMVLFFKRNMIKNKKKES